ncbi:MAG: FtsQ-type POTRA domain-containing protein [Actinomycetota bacterium]|nr:FtsQ-type POTRA domain-containing protein [Actinomycetota bacterium]
MDERIRARRLEVGRANARRRRRRACSLLGVLVLAVSAVAAARSPLFAIGDVRVAGVNGQAAGQARAAAGILPGQNLLWADLHGARERVRALAWVREAQIRRVPPSTVEIAVLPRIPVAVVLAADGAWLVDADGVVVAGGARDGLVAVEAPNSVLPAPGRPSSDAAVANALSVHTQLPADLRAQVDRYDASGPRSLRLHLRLGPASGLSQTGLWVRFGAAERVPDKARVIRALLEQAVGQSQLTAGGSSPAIAEIDVRAPDNPVLLPAA